MLKIFLKSYNKLADQKLKDLIYNNYDLLLFTITEAAPNAVILLYCYAKLIKILESDKTPFSYANHLTEQAKMNTYEIVMLYKPELEELTTKLNECISDRQDWGGANLSRALYTLTLQGRNEFYEKYGPEDSHL